MSVDTKSADDGM